MAEQDSRNRQTGAGFGGMGGMMGGMGMMGAMGGSQDSGATPARASEESKRAPSKLEHFLRASVFDFILVLVVAVCLTMTVSFGFEAAPSLRGDVALVAGLTAPMVIILFLGAYTKRLLPVSVVLAIVYAIGLIVFFQGMMPADVSLFVDGSINDVADNYVEFAFVLIVVSVLTYLLSRRRVGVFFLFFFGVITCQFTQYMFRDWISDNPGTLVSIVAFLAMGAMFVFQSYRSAVYQAKRVKRTHFAGASVYAVIISAICIGIGALLFFGIVANLGLSTPDIKPFRDYYQRPVVEYTGVYSQQQIDNPELTTSNLNDDMEDSNQDAEGGSQNQEPEDDDSTGANPISNMLEDLSNFDPSEWAEGFSAINYQQVLLSFLLVAIPIAAIIALILYLWVRRRRTRIEKLQGRDNAYKVWFLWAYLEERLRRLGYKRPESLTPMEYAMAQRSVLQPFSRGTGGVDHLQLTLIYQRAVYAQASVTDEDVDAYLRFYKAFFKNAREVSGKRKWIWRFWRM